MRILKKNEMKHLIFLIFSLTFLACDGQKSSLKMDTKYEDKKENKLSDLIFKENIDVAEAKTLIATAQDIILLDVRTPQEIAQGKIDNALEIDYASPEFKDKVSILDKNKEYVVYCAAGGRSAKAVKVMKELGFTKAHNLTSGYSGWNGSK